MEKMALQNWNKISMRISVKRSRTESWVCVVMLLSVFLCCHGIMGWERLLDNIEPYKGWRFVPTQGKVLLNVRNMSFEKTFKEVELFNQERKE